MMCPSHSTAPVLSCGHALSQKNRKRRRAREPERTQARALRDPQGRVHLVLHRDPRTGTESVTLTLPIFRESWQNELTAAVANTARGLLGSQPTLEGTLELARNAMGATSRLADGFLANAPAGAVACKAGCDHCCHQMVGVTAPEALTIFDHLQKTRAPAELESITQRIAAAHEQRKALSSDERFSPDHPCVFLVEGHCSIYEVRPLSCRGVNSLDAGECSRRLRDPRARSEFLAKGVGGHSFLEPIRAFHAISAGLQLSLAELYQLDMRPLELTAALNLLLQGSPSLASDWLRGQDSLEAARGGDTTSDAGALELSGTVSLGDTRH
jgi:Fe-S-cluster containining protein